jgi:hypothetical protein
MKTEIRCMHWQAKSERVDGYKSDATGHPNGVRNSAQLSKARTGCPRDVDQVRVLCCYIAYCVFEFTASDDDQAEGGVVLPRKLVRLD